MICQTFEELLAAPTCIPPLSRHECRQALNHVSPLSGWLGTMLRVSPAARSTIPADRPHSRSKRTRLLRTALSHAKASFTSGADSRPRARPSSPSSSGTCLSLTIQIATLDARRLP